MNMRTRNFAILLVATLTLSFGAYAVLLGHTPNVSAAPSSAKITLFPPAGPVQTPITVSGTGFTPGASVDLSWFGYVASSNSLGYYPIKTGIIAGSDGSFQSTFKAPFDFGVNVLHNVNATQNGVGSGIMNTAFNIVPSLQLKTQSEFTNNQGVYPTYFEGQEVVLQLFGVPADGIPVSPGPGAPPEIPIMKLTYDNNYWGWIWSHMVPVPVATGFPTGDAGGNATIRFTVVGTSKVHTIRAYEGSLATIGPWLGCEIGGEVKFETVG
jgi:hypothetical protein